jgi:serine phosphatase RsbU (regulator of sigma subunit)
LTSIEVAGDLRIEVAPEAKLRAVLEITKILGTALDLKDVLPKILEGLFTIFPQADRGFILLRDPGTGQLVVRAVRHRHEGRASPSAFSRTVVNYALQTGRAVLSADAGTDERFGISESIRALHLRSVMCVPMLSQGGAGLGVIQLDTLDKASQFRQSDLDVLVSASVQAARAVELAQLHRELRDLEAAREIQKSFLPESRPRFEEIHFFDYYSPARHVSGDYYDYIPLPGNRLAVALGDVSGKGVPAALLMARMSSAVRFCLATAPSVAEAVRQLSRVLTRVGTEDRFITFVVAVIDLARHSMTLVNAGHMPPLRRTPARPGADDVAAEEAGLPLAILDRPYEEVVVPLGPGDTFLLYTDGVTEARGAGGELYGIDRLRQLAGGLPAEPEALGSGVLADVSAFVGDRPQSDDITVVCFGRKH